MGASAHQLQFVPRNAVNQQPVRFDVCIAIALPDTLERMVLVSLRKLLASDQYRQQLTQLAQVFTALPGALYVTLKLPRPDWRPHLRALDR